VAQCPVYEQGVTPVPEPAYEVLARRPPSRAKAFRRRCRASESHAFAGDVKIDLAVYARLFD